MLIKAGVDISRLRPEIRGVLKTIVPILSIDDDEPVITSTFEGNHREDSYHYGNDAFDFTGRYQLMNKWAPRLKKKLPDYFDVVLEFDHIHVELDRRKFNEEIRG